MRSLRATLNDAGIPTAVASYDAWGVPKTPLIGSFGFTGELQRGSDVWLRARWYGAGRGGFGARDPWQGDVRLPITLAPYSYAWDNPITYTDPTGNSPTNITPLEGIYVGAVIAAHFIAEKPGDRWAEYPVPGGSQENVTDLGINGFADLVDFSTGEVYEIKPQTSHLANRTAAISQLELYILQLNRAGTRTGSSIEKYYRPRPATGMWVKGSTFLAGANQSYGLWPFGIDPLYNPEVQGYYEIRATMSLDMGIIIYWPEKINITRARQLVPRYNPDKVSDFIDKVYKDPYGRNGDTDWRKPRWGDNKPRLYPGLNMTDAGYWCAVTGDMLQYYYEELGRLGNQLTPNQPGSSPGVPAPAYVIPIVP